jgi:protein SCO1/2
MTLSRTAAVAVPALLALLLAMVLAVLIWLSPADPTVDGVAHRQLGLAQPPDGGDFQLDGPDGPLALSDLRGKVVLIYFGYTWCPDICPTNLAILALALRQLTDAEREQVQVLFVSVDPARDTLERLRQYTAYFHPGIIALTGTDAKVAAAAKRYGAAYQRGEDGGTAMGYLVDHSAYTYLVDPDGRLVDTLNHATPAEHIVARVRSLLAVQ